MKIVGYAFMRKCTSEKEMKIVVSCNMYITWLVGSVSFCIFTQAYYRIVLLYIHICINDVYLFTNYKNNFCAFCNKLCYSFKKSNLVLIR